MSTTPTTTMDSFIASSPSLQSSTTTFNAFSGADITAYMGSTKIATLEGITVSVTREVLPLFIMGDPNAQTFVKGKRAIAGNLVFTQFDKHAILKMQTPFNGATFLGQLPNFGPGQDYSQLINQLNQYPAVNNLNNPSLNYPNYDLLSTQTANAQTTNADLAATLQAVASRVLRYSDQVPPFDVTITMVNEMGATATTAVRGVQLVSEGWGYTVDDLVSQVAISFVAREIDPLNSGMAAISGPPAS